MRTLKASAPFYFRRKIQKGDDPARSQKIGPASKYFETAACARAITARNLDYLKAASGFACEAISNCKVGSRCNRALCAVCCRRYRRWHTAALLRLIRGKPAAFITVHLAEIRSGELDELELDRVHGALRKRLERAGFRGAVIAGGTELAWRDADQVWLLHCHLFAIDVPKGAIDALRAMRWPETGGAPVRVDQVRDPMSQATYAQKFFLIHHPGARTGKGRPRAFPLPQRPGAELANFYARRSPADFFFGFGVRRRGARLERA